jgi:hypothetical protein
MATHVKYQDRRYIKFIIIIIIIYFNCKLVFTRRQWYNKTQHDK